MNGSMGHAGPGARGRDAAAERAATRDAAAEARRTAAVLRAEAERAVAAARALGAPSRDLLRRARAPGPQAGGGPQP